jgi:Mrp family chromosome partitioning ATPase
MPPPLPPSKPLHLKEPILASGSEFNRQLGQFYSGGYSGLVDVLVERTLDLSDVMIRTDFEGLTILASGMSHSLSTELLASKGMADLVDEISRRYADRIVVFDTPPVLLASEAAALAQHVGQTVFVVKAESTGREIVKEALEVLKPARNVALVLNAVHPQLG